MVESTPGKYVRSGPLIELTVAKNTRYAALAERAQNATKLPGDCGSLKLLKASGAIISNEDIMAGGVRPWTIGNYLTLVAKRSCSQVTFGVACIGEQLPVVSITIARCGVT